MAFILFLVMMHSTPYDIYIQDKPSFVAQDYNRNMGTNMPTTGVG